MTAKVRVETSSDSKAAQTDLEKLAKTVEKVDKSAEKSATGAKKLSENFEKLTGVSLSTAVSLGGLAKIFDEGVKYLQESIEFTTQYAEQVRDLGRISGASAEETSKLIQVSDDLKVEYGVLTQAAKKLADEGIALTTEELAKASDKYLSYGTAAERTAFAVEKFGRAGLEMTKILEQGGDAIRAMADEQSGSLILSQDMLDITREYEKAQDALNDTMDGFKVVLGQQVIPIVTDFLTWLNNAIDATTGYSSVLRKNEAEIRKSTGTYAEYSKQMDELAKSTGWGIEATGEFTKYIYNGTSWVKIYAQGVKKTSEEVYNLANETTTAAYAQDQLIKSTVESSYEIGIFAQMAARAAQPIENMTGATIGAAAAMGELDSKTQDMITKDSLGKLTRQMIDNKIMATLSGDALYNYAKSVGLLDQNTYDFLIALDKLTRQFDTNKDGVVDATEATGNYNLALEQLRDKNILISMKADTKEVDDAIAKVTALGSFASKAIKVHLNIVTTESGGVTTKTATPQNPVNPPGYVPPKTGYATGTTFVIPAGYNENFPIGPNGGASSGETVAVAPKNQGLIDYDRLARIFRDAALLVAR